MEFARKVGAGEQVMSGCLRKSVFGCGRAGLCECSDVQRECARPLRADQHVILPDAVRRQHAVKDRVHVLGRIGQRRLANDLALERIVLSEAQLQRRIGIPWSRRRRVLSWTVVLAIDAEEIVRTIELVGGDLVLVRHVLDMLERGPDPLRTARGLMHRMKADQAQGFRQARPLRLRIAAAASKRARSPCGISWPRISSVRQNLP